MRLKTYITEMPQIIDLRQKYDEKVKVNNGTLYRKGVVIQVWWDKDAAGRKLKGSQGRETWTAPDIKTAKENFKDMRIRFSSEI